MHSSPPTWLYKKINVPHLADIQKELMLVSTCVIKDIENLIPDFHYIPRASIDFMLPITKAFLHDLGILDRWKYLALITGNHGSSLPLHVDGTDWVNRAYGLNLPVLNCKDSFTVYYNAEILCPAIDDADDPRASALYCREDTAVEIDRIEVSNPYWANVIVPHRPIVTHQLPRILASFRFDPELHDLLND